MPKARWTILSVVVALVLILFLLSIILPMVNGVRHRDDGAKCASNLHQIGLAILLYQDDNHGSYPRTFFDGSANPVPTWGTPYRQRPSIGPIYPDPSPFAGPAKVDANDVSASLYLLLREEKLTPGVFVCPYGDQDRWDFGGEKYTARSWTNWPGNDALAKHLSYSFFNEFPSKAAITAGFQIKNPDVAFAVASDINPGGTAVTSVTLNSSVAAIRAANSPNHAGDGQNVLYGDGHSEWQNNPFCGLNHDNIFTAGGPEIAEPGRGTASILKAPVSASDSVLLPTAADLASGSNR